MRQSASARQVRVLGNIQTNRQQDSYPVEPPISWRVLGDSITRAELDNKVQNSRALRLQLPTLHKQLNYSRTQRRQSEYIWGRGRIFPPLLSLPFLPLLTLPFPLSTFP